MSRSNSTRNPFYILLVVVGTAFAVTACAYGVMTLHAVRAPAAATSTAAGHPLFALLAQHGDVAMFVELFLLVALTCAAIGTDKYWDR